MFALDFVARRFNVPAPRNYPCLPSTCDPSSRPTFEARWLIPKNRATEMAARHALGAIAPQDTRRADIDRQRVAADRNFPSDLRAEH